MYMKEENTMMDFQQFTGAVKAGLQEFFPYASIRVMPAEKNNGLLLTGITIMEPGCWVMPTVYLDGAYCSYRKGVALAELVAELADLYRENRLKEEPEIPNILDFEAVKDLICCRLINRERNISRLGKMPHRDFLDLAIIYYIPVKIGGREGGQASITVLNEHSAHWTVDGDTLHALAVANTERLFPAVLQSIDDIIREGCPVAVPFPELGMYVIRNEGSSGGAAAMLNSGILRQFAEKLGDYYIFPSSIHEVILHPVKMRGLFLGKEEVCTMVREINNSQVAPEEVLSDNVYYYHAATGKIEILS